MPIAQTFSLGRYTVCAWLFAIAFHLVFVNACVQMQVPTFRADLPSMA